MADRYLPGRVAPTRIGQGKTYSDMLNEQLAFIQKQRQENLDKRVAQQEKNREFRQQQLQNIYDFDISGMSPAHIKAISDMQKLMASSLDPNSEDRYTSSSQLVADLAQLNNIFGVAEAAKSAYSSGLPAYAELVASGGVTTGSGGQMVGTMEDLDAKRALWDAGGFSGDIVVGGKAGERTITGIAMVPGAEGYVPGQQVDFFENTLLTDGNLWRPELLPPPDRLAQMAEVAMGLPAGEVNSNNLSEYVNVKFGGLSEAVVEDIRREIYEGFADPQVDASLEEMIAKNDPRVSNDAVKAAIERAYKSGIDARDAALVAPPVFDLSRPAPGGFFRVSEDQQFTINSSNEELAGKVFAIRFDDSQINIPVDEMQTIDGNPAYNIMVQFDRGNGKISEPITLSPTENPDEFRSLIRGLGQEGLTQLAISQGFDPMAAQGGGDADAGTDPAGGGEPAETEQRSEEDQRADLEIEAAEMQVRIQNAEEAEAAIKEAGTLEGALTQGISTEAITDAAKLKDLRQELADINTALGRNNTETNAGPFMVGLPNISPELAEEAPQTAAAIENLGSGGTITNPNTGQPLDETASTDEMVDATTEEVSSIIGIPLETMEGEMYSKIRNLVAKAMGDGGAWFDEVYPENKGAVAAWCAAFVSNLLLRQDENFRKTYGLSMYDAIGAKDMVSVGTQVVTADEHLKALKARKKDRQAGLQELYNKVEEGDIVFKRTKKNQTSIGHVGVFAGFETNDEGEVTHFKIFGGNQDDNLNITRYPIELFMGANRVQADLLTKEEWETISALSVRDPGSTR